MRNVFALAPVLLTFMLLTNGAVSASPPRAWCGDGVCNRGDGETLSGCSVDCYCGDGECQFDEGETDGSCYSDCGGEPPPSYWTPASGTINYPNNGIDWTNNQPYSHMVDDCFGNCGAGCSDSWNPCGHTQYWMLTLNDEPTWGIPAEICNQEDRYHVIYNAYQAHATWTYHGWRAVGCVIHDSFCPEWSWFGCAVFAGCGSGDAYEWPYSTIVYSNNWWSNYTIVDIEYNDWECHCQNGNGADC